MKSHSHQMYTYKARSTLHSRTLIYWEDRLVLPSVKKCVDFNRTYLQSDSPLSSAQITATKRQFLSEQCTNEAKNNPNSHLISPLTRSDCQRSYANRGSNVRSTPSTTAAKKKVVIPDVFTDIGEENSVSVMAPVADAMSSLTYLDSDFKGKIRKKRKKRNSSTSEPPKKKLKRDDPASINKNNLISNYFRGVKKINKSLTPRSGNKSFRKKNKALNLSPTPSKNRKSSTLTPFVKKLSFNSKLKETDVKNKLKSPNNEKLILVVSEKKPQSIDIPKYLPKNKISFQTSTPHDNRICNTKNTSDTDKRFNTESVTKRSDISVTNRPEMSITKRPDINISNIMSVRKSGRRIKLTSKFAESYDNAKLIM